MAAQGPLIPRVNDCMSQEARLSYLALFLPSWETSFQFYLEDGILDCAGYELTKAEEADP